MIYPEEEWKVGVKPTIKTIVHPKSNRLVVLLHHKNHFANMEINFPKNVAGCNLHQWNDHITFVLMTCGQILVNSKGE